MKTRELFSTTIILILFLSILQGSLQGQNPNTDSLKANITGISDIDQIRSEIDSVPTSAENIIRRHMALRRWWRLLWRQGYDMGAFDESSWILISKSDNTPEIFQAIDKGYSILEGLFANPVYIPEIEGAVVEADTDGQSENSITRTNWPFYHGIDGAQTGYSPDVGPSQGKIAWRFPKPNQASAPLPVLRDGKVYISRLDYCLDEVTGHSYSILKKGKVLDIKNGVELEEYIELTY